MRLRNYSQLAAYDIAMLPRKLENPEGLSSEMENRIIERLSPKANNHEGLTKSTKSK